jgi:hypothetical protein
MKMKIEDYLLSPLELHIPAGLKVEGLAKFQSSFEDHVKSILKQKDKEKAYLEALLFRESQTASLANQLLKAAADSPAPTRKVKKILSEKVVLRDEQGSITGLLEVSP